MKSKKNPKADLNKNSGLYFVIGLTLVLFLTWRALELKSYDTSIHEAVIAHAMEPDLDEEVPITKEVTPPPTNSTPFCPYNYRSS